MGQQAHSEELKVRIFAMWDNGESAGIICHKLNKIGVVMTRSAVIGVINRAGKKRDGYRPTLAMVRVRKAVAPAPKKPKVVAPVIEPPAIGPIRDFPGSGCRWMAGEPRGDFQFCGQPVDGSRYCSHHHARAIAV